MSASDGSIPQNLAKVHARIQDAERIWGRTPGSVSLLAVSKTFGIDAVVSALAAHQLAFGENYVQEGIQKIAALEQLGPRPANAIGRPCWHFIGPLQSNKTRAVAEHFDWVHTLDREKIARRLSEQRPVHLPPLNVLLQVNSSNEETKSGVGPAAVSSLAHAIDALPGLRLRGLMSIPAPADRYEAQRAAFAPVRALFMQLQAEGLKIDTLSMGMTQDLEAAIAEGATQVRIGTALFGPRAASR
jgi:pyridoxal phosphate enzyme (YggS family)